MTSPRHRRPAEKNARIVLAGTVQRDVQEYLLGRSNLVGRHESSQIQLKSPISSRRHARISQNHHGWVLEDLASKNGTFLNGRRVHGKEPLSHGDRIRFGDVHCVYYEGRPPAGTMSEISHDIRENNLYTEFFSLPQSKFLPEKQITDESILRRDYEKLRITYELQKDMASDGDIDAILARILDRIFEFLNYDQAVILLSAEDGTLYPKTSRSGGPDNSRWTSATLIEYVREKKMGVLSSDILTDGRFKEAASLITRGVRSSMAAPILHNNDLLGAIIIESYQKMAAFTEKDLLLIMNIAHHVGQFLKTSLLHEEMEHFFDSAIRTLSAMVDARHPLTAGHSERVAQYALMIGKQMGLPPERLEGLRLAALLHDIGKIGIPNRILLKKGKFSDAERAEMNRHPVITRRILEKFHFPKHLRWIPRVTALHHEKCNGNGYPQGLTGSHIPVEAKILAIADVFDALTSPRDYPKYNTDGEIIDCDRMPLTKVLDIIDQETGKQFDPEVAHAFKECLPQALALYRGNHFPAAYVAGCSNPVLSDRCLLPV